MSDREQHRAVRQQAVQRALKKDLEDQTLDAAGLRQLLRLLLQVVTCSQISRVSQTMRSLSSEPVSRYGYTWTRS